jgi:phenylalanyl-tRNA synthetase beta chain
MYMSAQFKQFKQFSLYPFIVRDVAFFVPNDIDEKRARAVIEGELRGKDVVSLRLFDSFEKNGRRSFAFRIVFQSMKKTLTDSEANSAMEGVYKTLRSRGCEVR